MVDCLRRHANISDYLHLPVQSGSDQVLRRMGRGYGVAEYLDLMGSLRAARSTVAISTDLIVGFPGESEADFEATLALVERARFSAIYAFCYSKRPGTAALRLGDDPAPEVAAERLRRLLDLQNRIQAELNATLVGREFEVLVTGWGRDGRSATARTSCHRIVHFPLQSGPSPRLGSFTDVRIVRSLPHSLLAECIGSRGGDTLDALAGGRRPSRLQVLKSAS
jgi:tRNA-2-methylthio-N6-dimethylallyladenosine synthase